MMTTLGALAAAEPTLQTMCALKLSAKHAYHVQKLTRLVAQETAHFHEQRNALVTEYGTKLDEGPIVVKTDSEHWPVVKAKLDELAAVPVEIPWSPITLDMFGAEKVSAADLQALGPLFAEPEP